MRKSIFPFLFILVPLFGCNSVDGGKATNLETNSNLTINEPTVEQTITQEDTEAVNNQHANERATVEIGQNGEEVTALNLYRNFELDVEYANDISFEVDYDNTESGMTAVIEDEVNNLFLSGDEAKNSLIKNFELLTFDENTEESEIVTQILTAFNLNEDFTQMELEVRYNSGTVKEYKLPIN